MDSQTKAIPPEERLAQCEIWASEKSLLFIPLPYFWGSGFDSELDYEVGDVTGLGEELSPLAVKTLRKSYAIHPEDLRFRTVMGVSAAASKRMFILEKICTKERDFIDLISFSIIETSKNLRISFAIDERSQYFYRSQNIVKIKKFPRIHSENQNMEICISYIKRISAIILHNNSYSFDFGS